VWGKEDEFNQKKKGGAILVQTTTPPKKKKKLFSENKSRGGEVANRAKAKEESP